MDTLKNDVTLTGLAVALRLRIHAGAYERGADRWSLFRAEALSAARFDPRFAGIGETIIRALFDGCAAVSAQIGYVAIAYGSLHMDQTLVAFELLLLALAHNELIDAGTGM